jgi:hypothetical protein
MCLVLILVFELTKINNAPGMNLKEEHVLRLPFLSATRCLGETLRCISFLDTPVPYLGSREIRQFSRICLSNRIFIVFITFFLRHAIV